MPSRDPEVANNRTEQRLDPSNELPLRREAVTSLARDDDLLPDASECIAKDLLTLSLAVHVRGVEERDAPVKRRAQRPHDVVPGGALKDPAQPRAAEAELRNHQSGCAQGSVLHEPHSDRRAPRLASDPRP